MSGFTELIRSLWCKLLLPVTTWNYHAQRGWLESKIYPDASSGLPAPGSALAYTYKPSGRLLTRIWARTPTITTTYSYNAAGDLQGIDYSDSTPDVTTTYDRSGRPKTMTDASGTRTLSYHESGQILDEIYSSGLLNGLSVTRAYDSLSRLGSLSALSATSVLNQIGYSYDAASRLDTVTQGTNTATYSYLTNSPLVGGVVFKQSGNTRLTTSKVYDRLNRLSSISSVPSASSAVSATYVYNAANQRTKLTREDDRYWDFGYDALGQVTAAKKYLSTGTAMLGHDFAYTFDDIGNRKTSTTNSQISNYTPNALNQYSQRTVPGAIDVMGEAQSDATVTATVGAGLPLPTTRQSDLFYKQAIVENSGSAQYLPVTITGVKNLIGPNGEDAVTEITRTAYVPATPEVFAHDTDGNLTADARWTYTWDGENRLIAMETSAAAITAGVAKQKLEFGYDGQSRRVAKKVYSWSGNAWTLASHTLFLHDGWNMVAELNALAGNAAIHTYAWGADLSVSFQGAGGVGGLVFANLGSTSHAPAFDGNGNVIGLVDMATGAKSATYEYGAFGETLVVDGLAAASNPFRFSTKYTDSETNLLYYGLRYYSPGTGRWPSRDPIEEDGGISLYGFCGNDALNHRDVLGLKFDMYTGDTSKIGLAPVDGYDVENRIGEHNAEITDFDFSLDVVRKNKACPNGNGAFLEFTGKLNISLTHLKGLDPATKTGSDGMTINDHERQHAAISKEIWNNMVEIANRYERCYCKMSCYNAAHKIVNQLLLKANADINLANLQFDWDHYGKKGNDPRIKFYIERMREESSRAELEIERALNDFRQSDCSDL